MASPQPPSPLRRLSHLLDTLGAGGRYNHYSFAGHNRIPLLNNRDIIELRFEESQGWTRPGAEGALVELLRNNAFDLHKVLEAANRRFEMHLGCLICAGGDFHAPDCPLGILTGRSEPAVADPEPALESIS